MCGIAGFYDPAGTERGEAVLARMLSTIRYRGPDDIAGFCRDGYGIGMVRLAIVDLVGGLQPALTPDRSVALVFNGEIFNYRDLRRELATRAKRSPPTRKSRSCSSSTSAKASPWRRA
jgi:Asparagine synthase (glutamine-hydrolyzing)